MFIKYMGDILTHPKHIKLTKAPELLIVKENRHLLQATLDEAQGRAYADILTADDIFEFVQVAETDLEDAGIASSYRIGATFRVAPSGPSARAYRYPRGGTTILLERKKKVWSLLSVLRVTVWPREKGRQVLTLTAAQKRLSLKRFLISIDMTHEDVSDALGFPISSSIALTSQFSTDSI